MLALIIGVVVLGGKKKDVVTDPADPNASGGTSQAPAQPATKASDAVQGYLEALAANDAAGALSFADKEPAETTLLTNEVLTASSEVAPITEINVPVVEDEYGGEVAATWKVGEKKVSEKFYVSKGDDDTFKLSQAVIDVDFSNVKVTDVPMSINGVEVTDDATDLSLFPGSYALTSGLKNLEYGDGELLIKSPSDYASTTELRLAITPDGKKAFISASKAALDKCVKQKKLAPSGCPNQINPPKDGSKVKKESMKWSVSGNPFGGMDPRLDYDDPTLATASASVKFKYEATLTKGGSSGKSKGDVYRYVKFGVDLTKDKPTATFE